MGFYFFSRTIGRGSFIGFKKKYRAKVSYFRLTEALTHKNTYTQILPTPSRAKDKFSRPPINQEMTELCIINLWECLVNGTWGMHKTWPDICSASGSVTGEDGDKAAALISPMHGLWLLHQLQTRTGTRWADTPPAPPCRMSAWSQRKPTHPSSVSRPRLWAVGCHLSIEVCFDMRCCLESNAF